MLYTILYTNIVNKLYCNFLKVWDIAKILLRGKFIEINAYLKKQKKISKKPKKYTTKN